MTDVDAELSLDHKDLAVFARPGEAENAFTPADQFAPEFSKRLGDCKAVVILHPQAFPWEFYSNLLQRKVVYVYLAGEELRLFDKGAFDTVFKALTPYDRIVSPVAKKRLERASEFAPIVKVQSGGMDMVISVCARDWAARNHTPPSEIEQPDDNPTSYWQERAEAYGQTAPEKTVGSIAHSLNANKRMHVAQARAYMPVFNALKRPHTWRAVELGCGTGRILKELERLGAEVTGVDASVTILSEARKYVPGATLKHASISEPDLLPEESFDVALFVTVFHHLSRGAKSRAIENALRALRQGGQLILLEDFASARSTESAITMPMSINEFVSFIAAESRGSLVLEDIRTIAYEHISSVRSAVIVFRRIGNFQSL